jgi:hypothetical protein
MPTRQEQIDERVKRIRAQVERMREEGRRKGFDLTADTFFTRVLRKREALLRIAPGGEE